MNGHEKALVIDRRARTLVREIETGTRKRRSDDTVYLTFRATHKVLVDVMGAARAALTLKELIVREITLFQPSDDVIAFDYLTSSFIEASPRHVFKYASTNEVRKGWLFDVPLIIHALARVFFSYAAQELAWGLAVFASHANQGGSLEDRINGFTVSRLILIYAGSSVYINAYEPSPADPGCVGERLPPAKGHDTRVACIRAFYGTK